MKSGKIIYVSLLLSIAFLLSSCIKVPQFDVMFSETQINIYENSGTVEVEFELPDGPRNKDVEVSFRFGGTARLGKDYTCMEERFIIIENGLASKSFPITLLNNIEEDGPKTIIVAIILVVQSGNTIYQGAERQSLTIVIDDDDCSVYIAGLWDYTATYFMYTEGDTVPVDQNENRLESGANPEFSDTVRIHDPQGIRDYYISDVLIGMFAGRSIETPSPLLDACGIISAPNDGSVKLMGSLPVYLNGSISDENTIIVDFEYTDENNSGGGFGHAILKRR